jgi:tripartite-type tricarboxylate transporter receptor subunit TctC
MTIGTATGRNSPAGRRSVSATKTCKTCAAIGASVLLWAGCTITSSAQSVQDFYKGRQLTLIVYSAAGSAYDIYGRALVRYMGKHIPGNPTFITQNMVGAGGLTALQYVYTIAPKDGTVILSIGRGVPFEPILGKNELRFDPFKLYWLGSMNRDTSLAISWKTSKVKTFDDLTKQELLVPGTGAGADSEIIPIAINNLAGTKFKIIAGYQNTTAAALAMERGELDGIAYWSWSALASVKPDWIPTKQVNILFQTGTQETPELKGVTRIREVVKNPIDKKALEFILAREIMGRPFCAGPDLPPERAKALRAAFAETMKDPEFLAEAKKLKLDVDLVTGEEVEKVLHDALNAPKEVIDRVKEVLERK